jgi:F-type H+-transporting ATPase subunit delta
MAEITTIARPYAEALFQTATAAGAGTAQQWLPAIEAVASQLNQRDVAQGLSNPGLSDEQRLDLITQLAGQPLPQALTELLKLILKNDRLAAFGAVAQQFRQLKNASEGAADCLVESAFPLSTEEAQALISSLSSKFSLTLKPELRLNPSLIGGVRVTVGDRVLDSSVRARLDAMQARLTA